MSQVVPDNDDDEIVGDVGCIWVIECDCWYDDNDEDDDDNDDEEEEEDMILNVISTI